MNNPVKPKIQCWICGDDAVSGEHLVKKSDLKSVYGAPTQAQPLYHSNDERKNVPVGSLNSKHLKSPAKICIACNTARTQPYDRAWEQFSPAIRSILRQREYPKSVRANSIFGYDTHRMMLNVHLYFVKLFGCHISGANIPIDLNAFSAAILNGKANQNVYLRFCRIDEACVGMTNIEAALFSDSSECAFAKWFYEIENLAVNVMYAVPGEKREGLVNAWHPRFGTSKLLIGNRQ